MRRHRHMFRSHRHSFGRTHTALGLLLAGLLSTSVEAAAAPDPFVMADGSARTASGMSDAADTAATRLLGRLTQGVPGPGGVETPHCAPEALTLIARRSVCEGASEELAPQSAFGPADHAVTQGHRDVPHRQRHEGLRMQTRTTE
jgi:hypothetical protein